MTTFSTLKKSAFFYDLPDERIAKFPLKDRDKSKLLCYQNREIKHHLFEDLPSLIPSGSLMVFNNTKVIPARLFFRRASGAWIEVFLLKPIAPTSVIQQVMEARETVTWEAMIGNLKKWKEDEKLEIKVLMGNEESTLQAHLVDREKKLVKLSWDGNHTFASIVEGTGKIPLPPYLNREPTQEDTERYQTVYSEIKGAVAAPTAGLHFTSTVLDHLRERGVSLDYLTLHVSAGTFQPIKEEEVVNHPMHSEQIIFTKGNIQNLINAEGKVLAVGTTSMRSLESLYWYGVKLMKTTDETFFISQDFPYRFDEPLSEFKTVMNHVLTWMEENDKEILQGETSIYIYPGYTFRVVSGLITNFHQPGSTLILLVAAFTSGAWKEIYQEALDQDYRFLSYGDSSLLWL